jgi:hypothetical protein
VVDSCLLESCQSRLIHAPARHCLLALVNIACLFDTASSTVVNINCFVPLRHCTVDTCQYRLISSSSVLPPRNLPILLDTYLLDIGYWTLPSLHCLFDTASPTVVNIDCFMPPRHCIPDTCQYRLISSSSVLPPRNLSILLDTYLLLDIAFSTLPPRNLSILLNTYLLGIAYWTLPSLHCLLETCQYCLIPTSSALPTGHCLLETCQYCLIPTSYWTLPSLHCLYIAASTLVNIGIVTSIRFLPCRPIFCISLSTFSILS